MSDNPPNHPAVQPGLYRHFKGHRYQVLGTVTHSETEEILVLYRPLYGARELWVRPLALFNETLVRDGETVKRFTRIADAPPDDTV